MKHLAIGPATIVSDADTLTASYTIATLSVGGAPNVPLNTGADGFNEVLMSDGPLFSHLRALGVSSLFFDDREGLITPASEGRPVAIEEWMSVRLEAAKTKWYDLHPDVMDVSLSDPNRIAYDLIVWLDFWFNYALTTGLGLGPAAFMWRQS